MANHSHRTAIWDAWLECEYQRRYWHAKASEYAKRELRIQIVLAVLTSSALLSILIDVKQLLLWKILSSIIAIISVAQPFLNYTKLSNRMFDACYQWHQLEMDFELMWHQYEINSFNINGFINLKILDLIHISVSRKYTVIY